MRYVARAVGERADEWRELFGCESVPILSDVPIWGDLPEGLGRRLVYLVDVVRTGIPVRADGVIVEETAN